MLTRTASVGWRALFVVVTAAVAAGGARASDTWSTPFPGGAHLHRVGGGQDVHVLVVDLCAPGVSIRTSSSSEKGRTVSSFGNLVGAAAATNGDFFNGSFVPDGPAMHDGAVWGGADHGYVAPVSFGDGFVDVPHHANQSGPAPGAREVVGGHPTLLDDGNVVGNPGDSLCTARHPRTMLGITQDHAHLIVAVVDGRRADAVGMTCPEEAALMAEFGAFDAVNLDGGGSSDMWIASEGGVQNRPSDGFERTVGNHFSVIAAGAGASPQCPTPPEHRAEFVAQSWPYASLPPVQIYEGDVVDGSIDLKNTGTDAWGDATKLAPIPRDVASPLAAPSWLSPTRVSHPAGAVAPGDTGHFALALAGNSAGDYDQFFGLVEEGVTWFADDGGPVDHLLEVRVTVLPKPAYRGRVVAVNLPAAVELDDDALATVDIENIGTATWDSIVKLAPTPRDQASPLAAESWLSPGRVTSADGDVAPGDVGRFTFEIHGAALGHVDQTFSLVAEGATWFANTGGPADDAIHAAVDVVAAGTLPDPPALHDVAHSRVTTSGAPPLKRGEPAGCAGVASPLPLVLLVALRARRRVVRSSG